MTLTRNLGTPNGTQTGTPAGHRRDKDNTLNTLDALNEEEIGEAMSAQDLIAYWIDHRLDRPPGSIIGKQGAAAKRICEKYTRQQIVQAAVGITQLFPHATPKNEPWDLFDLEKKFDKAMAAAHNHPDAKRQSLIDHLAGINLETFAR